MILQLNHPKLPWWILWGSLLLFITTSVYLWLAQVADTIGFSSNADFYYRNLHPVRFMLLSFLSKAGLAVFILSALYLLSLKVRRK